MDINHIKQILNLVREHELTEFEIEHDGLRLKLRKDGVGGVVAAPAAASPASTASAQGVNITQAGQPGQPVAVPSAIAPGPGGPGGDAAEIELAVVKSPIVGTFYRSAEPGAASFVEVGTVVKKGQVLCIIEAMKLMNEIDSEYDGEIVNVYVENGQSVQYGERLFAIKAK
jgi:acetyl-CoA carboxylase biotin carboxyl carrier protein